MRKEQCRRTLDIIIINADMVVETAKMWIIIKRTCRKTWLAMKTRGVEFKPRQRMKKAVEKR